MLVCVHKLMQNSKGELESRLLPRQQGSGAEPSQPQSQKLDIPSPETRSLCSLPQHGRVCVTTHHKGKLRASFYKSHRCVFPALQAAPGRSGSGMFQIHLP